MKKGENIPIPDIIGQEKVVDSIDLGLIIQNKFKKKKDLAGKADLE
jgi:hypothetical protein